MFATFLPPEDEKCVTGLCPVFLIYVMLEIFKRDDEQALDRQVTYEGLSVDSVFTDVDDDTPSMLKDKPCLLGVAAFLRAEKCFRYLFLHGADSHVFDQVFW